MPIIKPLKPQFEHLDSKDPEIVKIHPPKRLRALNPRGKRCSLERLHLGLNFEKAGYIRNVIESWYPRLRPPALRKTLMPMPIEN